MDIWQPLAEGQSVLVYEPGRLIYLQGTEAQQFYYILEGTVKVFLSSEDGNERTLTLHRAGSLIGEAAFFDRQPRVSSAVAVTRCEVVSVDRARLTEIFAAHPELAVFMLEYLARTVRLLSAHVDGAFLPADRRIARHLLYLEDSGRTLCTPTNAPRRGAQCVPPVPPSHCLDVTHEEIGFSVGVSRVTVSRVLGEFERRGWLRTGYRWVELLDLAKLEGFAAGGDSSFRSE